MMILRQSIPAVVLLAIASCLGAQPVDIALDINSMDAWEVSGGDWTATGGLLNQASWWHSESDWASTAHAFLREPVLADFDVTFEFRVEPGGSGVGAAQFLFRSTDNRAYYLIQFSSKADGVYLVRNEPNIHWRNIRRASGVKMPRGQWHRVRVKAEGPNITIWVNDAEVLQARDDTALSGRIGFGTSQAVATYRNMSIKGTRGQLDSPWQNTGGKHMPPSFKVICEDAGAGGYEAFPDICRCANGDLLCVFYAGYDHVSFPRDDLPKGARVSAVRSTDEGETWSPAFTVADTPWDDRDPHIACLSDGTLLCNWFTYYGNWQPPDSSKPGHYKELWTSFSTDNGLTWSEPHLVPNTAGQYWGSSAPVRELSDGTLIWPIYREYQQPLRNWTAVMHSTDGGKTWTDPVWVDETNDDNDEPDVCEMPDGRLLCVMRANPGDSMWYSWSEDKGRTWTRSEKIGFPGHAPYLFLTSKNILLLGHRLPNTALNYSLDFGKTWSPSMQMDATIGSYPSMLELKDGTILFVYYEEGPGSSIRAQKLWATKDGVEQLEW